MALPFDAYQLTTDGFEPPIVAQGMEFSVVVDPRDLLNRFAPYFKSPDRGSLEWENRILAEIASL